MDPISTTVGIASVLQSRSEARDKSDKGSTDQRRPVRRDLEKRRQQNIQAQKKYREKVKKRLDHLETLATSVAVCTGAVPAATPGADPSGPPTPRESPSNSPKSFIDHSDNSSVGFFDFTFPPAPTPASSSEVALWDSATSIAPSHLIHNKDTTAGSRYWVGHIDCGCHRPHVQISSSIPKEYRDLKVLNIGPDLFAADPYINTLRVERICLAQAIFSNCSHIGITEDMFCDDDAVSTFFRANGKSADDAGYDGTVKTIQSIYKSLKQDMRPIREQITTMHSPFIDVLPFPTFRRNLIQSGGTVDEEELYDDLLNGLVCWGGAGVGRRDRDCSTGYLSTGTPWDGRSWEARVWFLQKYWALLGGEDGELVQQSEWWRNMRGEEEDLWSKLLIPSCFQDAHNPLARNLGGDPI